jgi:hypothetical protein
MPSNGQEELLCREEVEGDIEVGLELEELKEDLEVAEEDDNIILLFFFFFF